MIIIGAGMAGLLCSIMNPGSLIMEAGPERETDHKAILRMRSEQISNITGIPFKKVQVHKSIWFESQEVYQTPRMMNLYAIKVSGIASLRSISKTANETRFIPPYNFVSLLKDRAGKIEYNSPVSHDSFPEKSWPIISTIPLPVLANALFDDNPYSELCKADSIYVNRFQIINCDSYATVYYPDPMFSAYRASLNGDSLIVEGKKPLTESERVEVLYSFGLDDSFVGIHEVQDHIQVFGKIREIDPVKRNNFILKATIEHNVYSLGRFATWRPKVMLDDVVNDVYVIRRLIESGNYELIKNL